MALQNEVIYLTQEEMTTVWGGSWFDSIPSIYENGRDFIDGFVDGYGNGPHGDGVTIFTGDVNTNPTNVG